MAVPNVVITMAAHQLCWPFCFTAVVYIFSSPLNCQGRLANRHQTLPHVRQRRRLIKFAQKFGWLPPPEIWRPKNTKFRRNFTQLRNLIANISSTQQDTVNQKMVLQTMDTPAQANWISRTVVHKWRKQDRRSDPPNGAAIRLCTATHLVFYVARTGSWTMKPHSLKIHNMERTRPNNHHSHGHLIADTHNCNNTGVSRTFFYEILVAASVECSSCIVAVASYYEISRARNFFATFR